MVKRKINKSALRRLPKHRPSGNKTKPLTRRSMLRARSNKKKR